MMPSLLARDGRHAVPAPSPRLRRRTSLRAGFTLIEILVVIVVIAILATLVAPNIFQHVGAAKDATAKSQIEMLGAALDAYRLDNGRYPTTEQALGALWEKPTVDAPANWRGPYTRKPVPPDPWGRPYVYTAPGQVNPQGYDLLSYGADGKPGGENEDADILSWK
jgi:general secretion pathway protein G